MAMELSDVIKWDASFYIEHIYRAIAADWDQISSQACLFNEEQSGMKWRQKALLVRWQKCREESIWDAGNSGLSIRSMLTGERREGEGEKMSDSGALFVKGAAGVWGWGNEERGRGWTADELCQCPVHRSIWTWQRTSYKALSVPHWLKNRKWIFSMKFLGIYCSVKWAKFLF